MTATKRTRDADLVRAALSRALQKDFATSDYAEFGLRQLTALVRPEFSGAKSGNAAIAALAQANVKNGMKISSRASNPTMTDLPMAMSVKRSQRNWAVILTPGWSSRSTTTRA